MGLFGNLFGKKKVATLLFDKEFQHTRIEINESRIMIGRGTYTGGSRAIKEENNIKISNSNKNLNTTISSEHCELVLNNEKKYVITDKSKNGTKVNGLSIKGISKVLENLDKIIIVTKPVAEFQIIYA
ncbi:FHA domain-containing protein [Candidatus Woesearchaeota archaeon]|jgi:pSer/pThr/pTyr-binding forkhead associated (FHA) protein|nr:FHA domain-containing protein [Candidatus Woesearchaeota archaeon]MBT4110919.1 FHA domain-containing protein [Candidatus Woesearchaeota archaeon]MBT4336569.1 FHA domain-containing protein [Candidatus Woesearchaeota archaeon]MBT4469682.1 FHA domain-containing protein [Candidatus Woesearchaeota archaeon]MBT6744044.1 FHA domain-containing protein [Candidatus Woesearchaeota archaeon]